MKHNNGGIMTDDKPVACFYAYDHRESEMYVHLYDFAVAVWEIKNTVRSWRKHGHDFTDADMAINKVYDMICQATAELPEE